MEKLKPCPFCGGEAKIMQMGYPHWVYCLQCGAKVHGGTTSEKDSIKAWNRRTEQKHGKWETEVRTIRGHKIPFFACSVCGRNADGEYPYCPNCGAKMDESEEECEDENWYTELDDPKIAERSDGEKL